MNLWGYNTMRQLTYELTNSAFKTLRNKHQEILGFKNLEEMLQEIGKAGVDVINAGENSFLTRKVQDRSYEAGNIIIIEILEDNDFNRLIHPSFHL